MLSGAQMVFFLLCTFFPQRFFPCKRVDPTPLNLYCVFWPPFCVLPWQYHLQGRFLNAMIIYPHPLHEHQDIDCYVPSKDIPHCRYSCIDKLLHKPFTKYICSCMYICVYVSHQLVWVDVCVCVFNVNHEVVAVMIFFM